MAWANVAFYNSGTSKTAGTPVSATAVAYNTGDVLFAMCACDDINAADAIGTDAVAGGTGLTWSRIATNQGQSNAGSVAQAVFVAQAVSNQTGQTVTFTPDSGSAAKVMTIRRFSGGVTATFGSHAINSGSASPFTCDARTADNGGLVIGFIAREGDTGDSFTGDSDTTNGSWSAATALGTSGGGAAGNIRIDHQYKITTAGGAQAYGPTGTNRDWRGLMVNMSSPNATITPSTIVTTSQVGAVGIPEEGLIEAAPDENNSVFQIPLQNYRYAAVWTQDAGSLSGKRRYRLMTALPGENGWGARGTIGTGSSGVGMDSRPQCIWKINDNQVGFLHSRYTSGANLGTIYTGCLAYNSGTDTLSGPGFGSSTLFPSGVSVEGTVDAYADRMADDKVIVVATQNTDASTVQHRSIVGTLASSSSTSFAFGTALAIGTPRADHQTIRVVGLSDTRAVVVVDGDDGAGTRRISARILSCDSGTGTTLATVSSWTDLHTDYLQDADWWGFGIEKIDSTRFIVTYASQATSVSTDRQFKAVVVDTTGDTVTAGTPLTIASNANGNGVADFDVWQHIVPLPDNKVLVTSQRDGSGSIYGTAATGTVVAGTTLNITKPTSTAEPNILWAFIAVNADDNTVTITPPTGFVFKKKIVSSGNVGLHAFIKTAGASEPASYDFTFSSAVTAAGSMLRYTGGVDETFYDYDQWISTNSGSSTNPVCSLLQLSQSTLTAVSATDVDVAHTAPSGYTERTDIGAGSTVRISTATDGSAASGGQAATFTAASSNWVTMHVPTPGTWGPAVYHILDVGSSGTTVTTDSGPHQFLDTPPWKMGRNTHFNMIVPLRSYRTTELTSNKVTSGSEFYDPDQNLNGGAFGFIDIVGGVQNANVAATTIATTTGMGAPVVSTSVAVETIATGTTISIPVPVIPVAAPVASIPTYTYIQSGSYLNLPASSAQGSSTVPDSAALRFTSTDMEGEWWGSVEDGFTHGSVVHLLVNKIDTLAVNAGGYYLTITTTGAVRFLWGTGSTNISAVSTELLQNWVSTGQRFGLKWTWVRNNGSSVWEVKFWLNRHGTWEQFGSTLTGAVLGVIGSVTWAFRLGPDIYGNNAPHNVRVSQIIMRDGIDGSEILNVDWGKVPGGTQTFTADTGQTVSRGATTSIVGLVNTGSTVTTTTVATTSTVGVPVTQTGSTVAATTIATASQVGVPAVRTGATPVSTAVATVSAVGVPTISAGSRVTTTVVATVSAVGVPVTRVGATISAATVATTSTVGVPVIPITIPVAAVATVSAVGVPTVRTGSTVTTTTVATASQVGVPVTRTGATFTPPAIATVSTVGVPTVRTGATVTTTVVATASQVGAIAFVAHATPLTTTVATVTAVGVPLTRTGATPTPPAISTTTSVGAPTISTGSQVTTVTVATTSQVGVPATLVATVIPVATVATTTQVGAPTILTSLHATVNATAVDTTTAIGAPAVTLGATPAPSTVVTVTTVGAPVLQTGVTPAPPAVATTSSVGAPTISAGSTVTATVVATATQVGAVAFAAPATVAAQTIATNSTVGVPVTRTGATVTTVTVATVSTVGATAIQTGVTLAPASIATTSTVGAPPVSTGSSVTTITIPTVTTIGTPALVSVATPAPATIATTTVIGSPVLQTGATPTPATIVTAVSIGTSAVSTGATITTTTVETVTQIGVPAVSTAATISVQTIATTSTVGAPVIETQGNATVQVTTIATATQIGVSAISAGATATPATVATTTAIGVPVTQTSSTVTPDTVATTTSIGTPVTQTGATVTAVTIPTTTTLGTPALSTGATPLPATVATVTAIGAPIVDTSSSATPTPTTIATVTTLGTPAVTTGAQPTPASAPTVTTVGAPTISTGSTVTTVTVPTVTSVGTAAVTLAATVAAQTIDTSSTVGAPVIATQGNVTVTPPTVATSSQVGTPVTQVGSTVTPQTIATSTAISVPVIDTATRPTPATVATTTSIGVPVITRTATALPPTIPTVTAIGSALITSPNLVPVSTVSTTTQVGVLVISSDAAAVVTTIGTSVQVLPVSIEAGATALVEAIQTGTQVGFVVVRTGLVVTLPVTLHVAVQSRSITASIQPRSLATNVAEQTVSTDFDEGLTIRRPDE